MTEQFGGDEHESLTTKEGWRRFVDTEPAAYEALPHQQPADTGEFVDDEERLDYHTRLAVVATPTIRKVNSTGRRLMLLNRHQISARRSLIITGAAGTGKTTAVTQLGRGHERTVRRRHPADSTRLPVAYISVPPAATARMLAVEFARFLGLPLAKRANQADVTNAVCGVLCDLSCDLVIVDEIHNLNLATRAGAEVSDQLKYLSERIPATFIYAGIDVAGRGLFGDTRGRQIAARFGSITTTPFPTAALTSVNNGKR
jgi:hypothetical protein